MLLGFETEVVRGVVAGLVGHASEGEGGFDGGLGDFGVSAQVVEELPEGEVFGPSRLAEEANRRYGRQLGKPVDARMASGILRRLLAEGTVRLVQKGGSHREALYGRG